MYTIFIVFTVKKKLNQGNFLTIIFDLSKNDIRDLIMMHKCRVFLTVVEKCIFLTFCLVFLLKKLFEERQKLSMYLTLSFV
jgi:hypothetical protein